MRSAASAVNSISICIAARLGIFGLSSVPFPSRVSNAHFPSADRSLGVRRSPRSLLDATACLEFNDLLSSFSSFFPASDRSAFHSFDPARARACVCDRHGCRCTQSESSRAIGPEERNELCASLSSLAGIEEIQEKKKKKRTHELKWRNKRPEMRELMLFSWRRDDSEATPVPLPPPTSWTANKSLHWLRLEHVYYLHSETFFSLSLFPFLK